MNTHHLTPRPARLAIAAFLAFGSTSVLAQEAVTAPPPAVAPTTPPAVQASPVTVAPPAMPVTAPATPAPATSAPATPAFVPSAPVVQATPSVEQNKAQAIAASQADAARPVERTAPAVATKRVVDNDTSRTVGSPRTVAPARKAPNAPAPVAAMPAPVERAVPSQPAAPLATVEPAIAQPAPQPAVIQSTNQALFWALGGGVLILAGLGGTALMRRRRRDELDQPVLMTEPAMVEPAPLTAPQPVRAAPVPVAVRAMTAEQRTLEEMVAAPPSPENPFLTHAKRLRRARFLLEQHNAAPMARENVAAPLSATAHPVDRSQTVYSFGKGETARATFLKPRTR